MTKVTGNVRLRLVKPFNVKTDKMFAEVFASISSHPSQPVRTRSYSYKDCECMPVILGNSVPFI